MMQMRTKSENEEDLIKKRDIELKHARDIRRLYDSKLERTNQLFLEVKTRLVQVRYNKRLIY